MFGSLHKTKMAKNKVFGTKTSEKEKSVEWKALNKTAHIWVKLEE